MLFYRASGKGIAITVKGVGHGYGLSQYEAQAKASEGWDFKQILEYFTKILNFALNKESQTGKNTSEVIKGER